MPEETVSTFPTAPEDLKDPIDPTPHKMDFFFINIGQGDCTLISCPDQRIVVVDCGSSRGLPPESFEFARAQLRLWWSKAGGTGAASTSASLTIDVILTHPDIDYYNKIVDLFYLGPGNVDNLAVNNIYFSGALSDDSTLGKYTATALVSNLEFLGFPIITEITINEATFATTEKVTTKSWASPYNASSMTPKALSGPTFPICKSPAKGSGPWDISILVGNLVSSAPPGSPEAKNCGTLVTLCNPPSKKKVLLTGDATTETLDFLYKESQPLIGDLQILVLPHHGSEASVFSDALRAILNPKEIIISVGLLVDGYNFTRYEVLS